MTLNEIQQHLKAPKGQRNNFGNYNYRSCEDILESVKPLLGESILNISDEIIMIGDRFYVKATAKLYQSDGKSYSSHGWAREQQIKKGMDESQITGSASSYARKYALNGLFCIDDTKDADTQDNTAEGQSHTDSGDDKPWLNLKNNDAMNDWLDNQKAAGKTAQNIIKSLRQIYKVSRDTQAQIENIIGQ